LKDYAKLPLTRRFFHILLEKGIPFCLTFVAKLFQNVAKMFQNVAKMFQNVAICPGISEVVKSYQQEIAQGKI
jgi:hypothetical protein